jgi:NNP family nitrate/nitrite transporter-like MFS transporter
MRIVLIVTGLMTLFLGIASRSVISYAVFLQPLVAVCFFPAGFAAMSLIVSAKLRSIAVSLITPLAFVGGGGLAPILIGFIGDRSSFAIAITICGAMIGAGSIVVGLLKFDDQRG